MKAERLDNARGALLELARHGLEAVGREKTALVGKLRDLSVAFLYIGVGHVRAVFFLHGGNDLLPRVPLVHRNDIVCDIVHRVDGA